MSAGSAPASSVRRITKELLDPIEGQHRAFVMAAERGVVAGLALLEASQPCEPSGIWRPLCADGENVDAGAALIEITGTAWELAVAEDHAMGVVAAASGFARRAREIVAAAPNGLRIVCGGWKKLPAAMKPVLRAGLDVAGIGHRLLDDEFVYVDKNVVRLLGGVARAVQAGLALGHGPVSVQVVDVDEARRAVAAGCGVVMVDTGDVADLAAVDQALRSDGTRDQVRLAFAGGVSGDDLVAVTAAGADIVDIGRAVLDAPLWDLRMVVQS